MDQDYTSAEAASGDEHREDVRVETPKSTNTPPVDPEANTMTLKTRWAWYIFAIWILASWSATLAQSLPRDAFPAIDGISLGRCGRFSSEFDEAIDVKTGDLVKIDTDTIRDDWCSWTGSYYGPTLPAGITYVNGQVNLEGYGIGDVGLALVHPQSMLLLALGGAGILCLFVFSQATGTFRTGLAAMISITFLGLLLFPNIVTRSVPIDLRTEMVSAWKWVIAAYFGSEASIQALKIWKSDGKVITGDVPT